MDYGTFAFPKKPGLIHRQHPGPVAVEWTVDPIAGQVGRPAAKHRT